MTLMSRGSAKLSTSAAATTTKSMSTMSTMFKSPPQKVNQNVVFRSLLDRSVRHLARLPPGDFEQALSQVLDFRVRNLSLQSIEEMEREEEQELDSDLMSLDALDIVLTREELDKLQESSKNVIIKNQEYHQGMNDDENDDSDNDDDEFTASETNTKLMNFNGGPLPAFGTNNGRNRFHLHIPGGACCQPVDGKRGAISNLTLRLRLDEADSIQNQASSKKLLTQTETRFNEEFQSEPNLDQLLATNNQNKSSSGVNFKSDEFTNSSESNSTSSTVNSNTEVSPQSQSQSSPRLSAEESSPLAFKSNIDTDNQLVLPPILSPEEFQQIVVDQVYLKQLVQALKSKTTTVEDVNGIGLNEFRGEEGWSILQWIVHTSANVIEDSMDECGKVGCCSTPEELEAQKKYTPLEIKELCYELVEILLSREETEFGFTLDPNGQNHNDGTTALFFSVESDNVEMFKILLRHGANPLHLDDDGESVQDSKRWNKKFERAMAEYNNSNRVGNLNDLKDSEENQISNNSFNRNQQFQSDGINLNLNRNHDAIT